MASARKTPKTVQDLAKKSLGTKKSSKTKGYVYKLKKHFCKRHILPMKKPEEMINACMANYPSTLHKPVGDEVKVVPKEILEIEETAKKVKKTFVVPQFDPLAKYRHLKITYIAIKKPKRPREKYLPAVVDKLEGKSISEQEKNDIINFRFEILRRLNEEFHQIQNHPTKPAEKSPPAGLIVHDFDNSPAKSDKPVAKIVGHVKKDFKKESPQKNKDMNAAKILFQIKPSAKNCNAKGIPKRIIVDENESNLQNKGLGNNNGGKKNDGGPKTGDGTGGVGGGSARKFSTFADDKYVKPDDPDPYECVSSSQKTYPNEGDCESPVVIQGCPEPQPDKCQESPVCQEEEEVDAFDIVQEVPNAFECASEQLEEHRRENLFYRYHQKTWYDLHQYLNDKRVFSIDKVTAEQEKTKETENKDGSKP